VSPQFINPKPRVNDFHLGNFDPGSLCSDGSLLGIIGTLANGPYCHKTSEPETNNASEIDVWFYSLKAEYRFFWQVMRSTVAVVLTVRRVLIAGYSLKCSDYPVTVGLLLGNIPFLVGRFLIFPVFRLPS